MSRLKGSAYGREAEIAGVMAEAIELEGQAGPWLIAEDPEGHLEQAGARWSRWSHGEDPGTVWPPEGPFGAATLRIPKSREAFEMAMHAVASRLAPGAPLYVYGGNDEGIKSADKKLATVFGRVEKVLAKRKSRVIEARDVGPLRTGLEAWARTRSVTIEGEARDWLSYPGLFAKGGLDEGTQLLLEGVGRPEGRVLDFGCGTGVVAATLAARGCSVEACDADALAVAATRHNSGVLTHLGDGWAAVGDQGYDLVVSNPPIHSGKREDFRVLKALLDGAKARRVPVCIVVQRQVPVEQLMKAMFDRVSLSVENGRFRVWRGE